MRFEGTADHAGRMSGFATGADGRRRPFEAVRLRPAGRDRDVFIAMGAQGQGAIYTEYGQIIHIIRKVIIRVSSKLDWLVLKLH